MSDDLEKILSELREMKKELREAREQTEKAEQEAMQKLSLFQDEEGGANAPEQTEHEEVREVQEPEPSPIPKRVIESVSSIGDEPEQNPEGVVERLETVQKGGAKLDKLLEIVARKGKAKRSEIAKEMGITPQEVERLGEILSKHGIIRMRYPFLGEPVLEMVKKG